MELIKFEKKNCPKCDAVGEFFKHNGVEGYKKVDIEKENDLDFIAKYVSMQLPVVVLLDDNKNVILKSEGFVPSELEEIAEKLQG